MVFILSFTHYSSKYDFLRTCKSFGEEISRRRREFLLLMVGPRGKRMSTFPFLDQSIYTPLINPRSCLVACQFVSQYFFVLLNDWIYNSSPKHLVKILITSSFQTKKFIRWSSWWPILLAPLVFKPGIVIFI
jgi:hypothetical protein